MTTGRHEGHSRRPVLLLPLLTAHPYGTVGLIEAVPSSVITSKVIGRVGAPLVTRNQALEVSEARAVEDHVLMHFHLHRRAPGRMRVRQRRPGQRRRCGEAERRGDLRPVVLRRGQLLERVRRDVDARDVARHLVRRDRTGLVRASVTILIVFPISFSFPVFLSVPPGHPSGMRLP